MDVYTIQNGLTGWLRSISGKAAVIENEPRPAILRTDGFWIVSPPDGIRQLGEDYTEVSDTGIETVIGRRGFMCVIKYIVRDQNPQRNARYWLEQARMSLKRTVVLEHFQTYGVGIQTMRPTVSYDALHDGRMESIAAAELHMSCAVRAAATDDIGYIETVEVSGTHPDNPTLDYTDTIGPVD